MENEFRILTFSDIESSHLSQSENNSNLLKSPEYNKTMNQIGKSQLEETVPVIFTKNNKEISKEQKLEIYSSSEKKTYIFVEGGYIGKRIDNKISFNNDNTISLRHCYISKIEKVGFFIQDEKSTNGTYIWIPQDKELFLKEHMRIQLGSVMYVVKKIDGNIISIQSYHEGYEGVTFTVNGDCKIGSGVGCETRFKLNKTLNEVQVVLSMKYIKEIKKSMMVMKPIVAEG